MLTGSVRQSTLFYNPILTHESFLFISFSSDGVNIVQFAVLKSPANFRQQLEVRLTEVSEKLMEVVPEQNDIVGGNPYPIPI